MNTSPNKLINEKSPYLLQHAYNPVNWFTWSDEAFNLAKELNKPIFLSIGYSTCHWCHVMAHESFENKIIADYLNQNFVSIKLDREEHPEIDNIYMHICQMVNGNGGWPLSVFMDFNQKPFFVNTYFPPDDRHGRIGFLTLLKRINDFWINEPEKIAASINALSDSAQFTFYKNPVIPFNNAIIDNLFEALFNSFDKVNGGFGTAPKFPSPQNFLFLLSYSIVKNNNVAIEIVENTLKKMRNGGIFDQIGSGFHRYSTDKKWLLPHFEKMLYDQAMLILAYTQTYKLTGNNFYRDVTYQIIKFLKTELLSPEGAFYSAIDADSDGEEGKFYTWSFDELKEFLPNNLQNTFFNYFNITEEGNFEDERTRKKIGKNILHITEYDEAISKNFEHILQDLYYKRSSRVHPITDTKILTDWNGLIIWALAESGVIFKDNSLINIAENCLNFIKFNLIDENNKLLHRFIDGEKGLEATADDYAFLIKGLLTLHKAANKIEYLLFAINLNDTFIDEFWDEENYGFYFSPKSGKKLLTRSKQYFDNAIPSANSIAGTNLLELYSLTGENKYISYYENLLKAYDDETVKYTRSLSMLITSYLIYKNGFIDIIIAENNNRNKAQQFLDYIHANVKLPYTLIYLTEENFTQYKHIAPFIKSFNTNKEDAYIYVCKNGTCNLPTNDFLQLKYFDF